MSTDGLNAAAGATIEAVGRQNPPAWAIQQRFLIDLMDRAAPEFVARYTRPDGTLVWRQVWPGASSGRGATSSSMRGRRRSFIGSKIEGSRSWTQILLGNSGKTDLSRNIGQASDRWIRAIAEDACFRITLQSPLRNRGMTNAIPETC